MGVCDLWRILDQNNIAEERSLTYLNGKKLAVDLSGWVVQSLQSKGLNKSKKPHLKNLFHRVRYLLLNKIHPIFVTEGRPPVLKENTVKERNINQFLKFHNGDYVGGSGYRERLTEYLSECESMLKSLGILCLKSNGEAEALCAFLNYHEIVDGCITEDSDAFLYGAKTVFRDFSIYPQDHKIKEYSMATIEKKLFLTRKRLVALALLLGSDYNKGGVTGIGKEAALSMFKEMGEIDILERFRSWKSMNEAELFPNYNRNLDGKVSHCIRCEHLGTKTEHKNGCEMCKTETKCLHKKKVEDCSCEWHKNQEIKNKIKNELKIYEKAKLVSDFPDQKVIDEYLGYSATLPNQDQLNQHCPDFNVFEEMAQDWFGWSKAYCIEKVLPLITTWQMNERSKGNLEDFKYDPVRIIKQHKKDGKLRLNVQWKRTDGDTTDEDLLRTSEDKEHFSDVYPAITKVYYDAIEEEKNKKAKPKRSPKKIASPSKTKGNPPDLVQNAKMENYFPTKSLTRKRAAENSEQPDLCSKVQAL